LVIVLVVDSGDFICKVVRGGKRQGASHYGKKGGSKVVRGRNGEDFETQFTSKVV